MQSIFLYKVVYNDQNNCIDERDFPEEAQARQFALRWTFAKIFKVGMVGSIEEII